ncbi:hypothetical protein CPB84DRAFT_1848184 [Gymnopilus junonius]|uniref:Uncharacterized protein n=1 Tax=Gymnopilus junonius TaxID=109634 RepID=A0A9P5TMP5_GYMJU|nr:hypothetical protein CPB84DRAFT_1848184 [Gymnopilus junonius]
MAISPMDSIACQRLQPRLQNTDPAFTPPSRLYILPTIRQVAICLSWLGSAIYCLIVRLSISTITKSQTQRQYSNQGSSPKAGNRKLFLF